MVSKASRYPRYLRALRKHGLDALAADEAGLSLLDVQERQATDAAFSEECARARRLVWERLVKVAQDQATAGDTRLLVHLLRHHSPPAEPTTYGPLLPPVRIFIAGEPAP